jgi:hypothetical protein
MNVTPSKVTSENLWFRIRRRKIHSDTIVAGKPFGGHKVSRRKTRLEDNIQMDFRETGLEDKRRK